MVQRAFGLSLNSKKSSEILNSLYKYLNEEIPEMLNQKYLDTMEKVYQDTNKIIIDKDISKGILPFLPLNKMDNK